MVALKLKQAWWELDVDQIFYGAIIENWFMLTFAFSAHNASSYRACVQLLSSLSGYQYTRRAWKKEAFDLFMDSSFFQMDASCVNQ